MTTQNLCLMTSVRRSVFRPCIDLHDGQVKQIVGGSLSERTPEDLKTNFVSRLVTSMLHLTNQITLSVRSFSESSGKFARIYRDNGLEGGHVIKLGPGNDTAAKEALRAWPGLKYQSLGCNMILYL